MNAMHKITFIREHISIEVPDKTTLMEAAKAAGVFLDAPCGGMGTCGKCLVKIKEAARPSSEFKSGRACQTEVLADLMVETLKSDKEHQILTSSCIRQVPYEPSLDAQALNGAYMAAIDIGTTTIASYLLEGSGGTPVVSASMVNPQAAYGADVISRADYTLKHGPDALKQCIRKAVNQLLETLCKKAEIQKEQIIQLCLVGNTCMHHLFFGYPVNSLVLAPYTPYEKTLVRKKASFFDIHIHPEGELMFLPVIAGFVGADTMGCLLSIRPDLKSELSLIIDIGTNGELVLGNKDRLVCCSAAAGPAFEGAKIQCGMRGARGAVDHVFYEDGRICYSVIGNTKPKGICGSGLIDTVACLLRLGLMDETGALLTHEEAKAQCGEALAAHIIQKASLPAFLFDPAEPSVFLTQKDIREVQLAKGAIAAGILLLEKHLGVTHADLSAVYVAGAFGNYMNPKSACAIGLLPAQAADRIYPVGNAAGEGAKLALQNKQEASRTLTLMEQVEFLELAAVPDFQDCFIDELEFSQENL